MENEYTHDIETNSLRSTFINFGVTFSGEYTLDEIKNYRVSPMIYNRHLRKISLDMYNRNGQLHNAINDMVAMPTLDYITVPMKPNDVGLKRKELFDKTIEKLVHKRTSRDAIRTDLLDGFYIAILRNTKKRNLDIRLDSGSVETLDEIDAMVDSDNLMFQPLNLDYCKVIGFRDNAYVSAFDMSYFDQFKYGGLINEIKTYPQDFISAYTAYKKDASKRWYKLDPYNTITLKLNSSIREPYGRPYCISAMTDIKMAEDYEDSQNKVISELASSIYMLSLPEGKEKGTCSLKKTQQEAVITSFENAVKINTSTNQSKITSISLPPGSDIKRLSKDASLIKDTLSDEYMKKVATSLGFAESALNGSSEGGASYASLQVNLDIISSRVLEIVERLSEEYTRILNYYLFESKNPQVLMQYLGITHFNKKDMKDSAKELYTNAGGSRRVLISASGYDQNMYLKLMELEKLERLDEKFPPHITSYTASDRADLPNPDDNLGGRPKSDDGEITPAGQATRDSGGV